MAENFFSGLAGGFSAGQEQRRLRQVFQQQQQSNALDRQMKLEELGMRKEEFGLRREEFGLRKQELGLSGDRLELEKDQQAALLEHQKFQRELAQKQYELDLRKQDFLVSQEWIKLLDPNMTPGQRAAALNLYAQTLGVDTKSDTFKSVQSIIKDMDEQALTDARQMLTRLDPNANPGERALLGHLMWTNPEAALKVMDAMKGIDRTQKNMVPVIGADGVVRYGDEQKVEGLPVGSPPSDDVDLVQVAKPDGTREWVKKRDALGQPAPGPATETPEEARLSQLTEARVKSDYKRAEDYEKSSADAPKVEALLDAFETAMTKEGGFKSGPASGVRLAVAQWAQYLGIDKDPAVAPLLKAIGANDASSGEAMAKLTNLIANEAAEALSSRVTNMSLKFFIEAAPGLMTSPEGNAAIIEVFRRSLRRDKQVGALIEKYKRDTSTGGDLGPPGKKSVFQEIADLDRTDPIISPEFKNKLIELGKKGSGINMGDVQRELGNAGSRIIQLGNKMRFETKGMDEFGNRLIAVPIQGKTQNYPVLWDTEDAAKLPDGTVFVDGKTGMMVRKKAAPGGEGE